MTHKIMDILNINDIKEQYFNNWFISRNLRLDLEYQKGILLKKLPQAFADNKNIPVVLGACPSAGKTIMSIFFVEQFLRDNPKSSVLILTHGTDILRTQYEEEIIKMHPDFSFTRLHKENSKSIFSKNSQVYITLPQTISNFSKLPNFDLIVVDEAHHFYFAEDGMVKKILQKVNPSFQLLLTGTPSPFVKRKFPIISVSVNELLDIDMVSDVIIEIASSTYKFNNQNYNRDFELKTGTKFKEEETNSTLDLLLNEVSNRLRSVFRNNPVMYSSLKNSLINKVITWDASLRTLNKTMIACKTQEQARQVYKYFKSKNINIALSTSDDDKDTLEIKRFKEEKNCLVLIVVARGVLGFNLPELENVIDMTGSQNIDRVFQLLCRVLRKHPQNRKKMFFKIAPNYLEQYFEHVMTGVVCLTDNKYYLSYNGKNFLDMEIPVLFKREYPQNNSPKDSNSKNKIKREIKSIDYIGLPSIKLFKDILHTNSGILNSYAYASMREIRNLFFLIKGPQVKVGHWNLENCKIDALKYKTLGEWAKNSSGAYNSAIKNDWINFCCSHMPKPIRWTLELCIADALKYQTRTQWIKNSSGAYAFASLNGHLDECCKHMKVLIKPNGYWTKERCIEDAQQYKTKKEWFSNSPGVVSRVNKNGWLKECCKHMAFIRYPKGFWTLEKCKEEALKYKSKSEWKNNSAHSFDAAQRKGWIEECSKHMKTLWEKKWDYESCKAEALKYKTKSEWNKNSPSSANAARNNKWYEELTKHMKPGKTWDVVRKTNIKNKNNASI